MQKQSHKEPEAKQTEQPKNAPNPEKKDKKTEDKFLKQEKEVEMCMARYAYTKDSEACVIRINIAMELDDVLALVDTGSTYNLINLEFAKENVSQFHKKFTKQRNMPSLSLGDGTKMKTHGWIDNVKMSMTTAQQQSINICANFLVIAKLPENIVLGHQYFMESRKLPAEVAEISYAKKAVLIGKHRIPWKYQLTQTPTRNRGFMYSLHKHILKAYTTQRIPCQYDKAQPSAREWGFFSNIAPAGSEVELVESYGNLSATNQIDLWMTNITSQDVVLESKHPIAIFDI